MSETPPLTGHESSRALAIPPERAPVAMSDRGVELRNLDELARFCAAIAKSQLAPKGFQTAEAVMVAVQMGLEVGLSPMAALSNICVINGKPAIYGDAALALVRASGLLEEFEEYRERGGSRVDTLPAPLKPGDRAICVCRRKGYGQRAGIFTYEDALHAGLLKKQGPWTDYPARMLQMRARSFALRDEFSDVLKGFRISEEVGDYGTRTANVREVEPPTAGLELPAETEPEPLPTVPATGRPINSEELL